MKARALQDKFWPKVDKRGPDDCWNWKASILKSGYGNMNLRMPDGKYRTHTSHRLSWELHNGQIPDGLWVLHKCDNRACVNPAHLFLGTQQDNIADCVAKRRHFVPKARTGENNERSLLDGDQVARILSAAGKVGHKELAAEFGVAKSTIAAVISRKTWKHIEVQA